MKVLMVLTSHDRLGDTGKKTGFWLEELARRSTPRAASPMPRPTTRAASKPMTQR